MKKVNYDLIAHSVYYKKKSEVVAYIEQQLQISKIKPSKFYFHLLTAMNNHFGRQLMLTRYNSVSKLLNTIIDRPKKQDRFRDFLTDAGKQIESKLIEMYRDKEAQYMAMGLIAMYDLGLLKSNPASTTETNQSALVRALQNDLNPKLTRQALQLGYYSESAWHKHKKERQLHLKLLDYVVRDSMPQVNATAT